MAEVNELRELLTIAKNDLLYLLLELKAQKQKLNVSGLAGLMCLRDICSIEKVDKDFIRISDYLERYENKTLGMDWIMCKDCIYVDECNNTTNSDGCYFGATEDEDWEEE